MKRIFYILFFFVFLYFISIFINSSISFAATEFVSSIMQSGGDYNTLFSWEAAINTDLTVSSTKVYSASSTTGTVSDGATVTGSVSTTTKAKALHNATSSNQVLVENIRNILTGTSTFSTSSNIVTGTGTLYTTELAGNDYIWLESSQTWQSILSIQSSTQLTLSATSTIAGSGQSSVRGKSNFQSGEQLQVNGSNYVVISNTGDSAIATAKIDGAWTSADTTAVLIDGWTTTSTNYIRIYTTTAARHNGKWDDTKYRFEINDLGYSYAAIKVSVAYVRISGLQFLTSSNPEVHPAILLNTHFGNERVNDNVFRAGTSTNKGAAILQDVYHGNDKIYNNVIYDYTTGIGLEGANSGLTSYVYNNTIYNSLTGISALNLGLKVAINNIVASSTTSISGIFAAGTDYNATASSTMGYTVTGGGNTHDRLSQTFTFVNATTTNGDFHLAPTDAGAKDYGVSNPGAGLFSDDIDGQTRPSGSAWDIGADEFVNTAPNAPVSLGQYQSGCSSSISTSTYWVSTSTVCFQGKVSDPDINDLEKLQVELSTSTFSNSPNYTASTFTTSTATSSAVATATSSITVSSLPDANYKWQSRLLDYNNGTSSFTQFNSGTNSFGVDTTSPTGTIASSTFGTITSSSIIINRPSTSTITESGSGLFQWQARRNSTTTLSAVSTSTATTSDSSLTSNTQYTYDVRFIDATGNISSYGATSSKYTLTPTPTNLSTTPSQTSNTLSVDSINNASSSSSGYYFSNTTNSNNSSWITTNSYSDTGLTCNTLYAYTIKYRNGDATESATSSISQTTSACTVSAAVANAGLPISILASAKSAPLISSPNINQYPLISTNINQYQPISFSNYLYPGLSDKEVKNLQTLLSNYPDIYPEAKITGYFGPLTKQAIQRFQLKYNITDSSDTAFGYVGPKTRKILNLLEQINYLRNQLNQILNQIKKPY